MRARIAVLTIVLSGARMQAQSSSELSITISGVVTDSVTGRGIAGALVTLQAGPSKAELTALRQAEQSSSVTATRPLPKSSSLRAVTDEGGKYIFKLPEPTFAFIQASHASYSPNVGRTLNDFGHPVELQLVPTSVIEGRVVNSNGEPLPGINIEVIRAVIQDGRKVFRGIASSRSDDLGEYRIWNITRGSVFVRAVGPQGTASGAGKAPLIAQAGQVFAPVYFPGASDRQSAAVIRVPPGQTVRADFSLEARKPYRILGVVKDAASYQRLNIRLLREEDSMGGLALIDNVSGEFQVYNVTPGTYTIQAYSNGPGSLALGEASVMVRDQDVSGVVISLSTGVKVRGVIEHTGKNIFGANPDGRDHPDIQSPRFQRRDPPVQVVILQPRRLPVSGIQPPATVDGNGQFTFVDMLPGKYAFTIRSGAEYVAYIRSGTTDVLSDGLEVRSVDPEPISVALSTGGASISGAVTGLRPGEFATVALIRSAGASGVPTITRTDGAENPGDQPFQVGNLAPGEYSIYAWPSTQEVEYRNPEALRAISGNAVMLSLREGGDEQVKLKAISVENE